MMPGPVSTDIELQLRRLILALLALGLAGVGVELVALGHFEDPLQLVPLGLIAGALGVIAWHAVAGRRNSLRALRVIALLLMVSGGAGVFFHYRGNMEFQLDTNPDLSGWPLFAKILHAKAPPALAPGVMAQLGLLGLIYTFRHLASRLKP